MAALPQGGRRCLARRGGAAADRPLGPGVAPLGRRSPVGGRVWGLAGNGGAAPAAAPAPWGWTRPEAGGCCGLLSALPAAGAGEGRAARGRRRPRRAAGRRRHAAGTGLAGPVGGEQDLLSAAPATDRAVRGVLGRLSPCPVA